MDRSSRVCCAVAARCRPKVRKLGQAPSRTTAGITRTNRRELHCQARAGLIVVMLLSTIYPHGQRSCSSIHARGHSRMDNIGRAWHSIRRMMRVCVGLANKVHGSDSKSCPGLERSQERGLFLEGLESTVLNMRNE